MLLRILPLLLCLLLSWLDLRRRDDSLSLYALFVVRETAVVAVEVGVSVPWAMRGYSVELFCPPDG